MRLGEARIRSDTGHKKIYIEGMEPRNLRKNIRGLCHLLVFLEIKLEFGD